MVIQKIREAVERAATRIPSTKGRGEEATKQALILPIIAALGYDIHNPCEVCPEYDADFAIRKGALKEKVDLAILQDETPTIFIEAKALGTNLDDHAGQLSRYFNSSRSVVLGILTNGAEWRFFTDTVDQNLMDSIPFATFRVDYPTDSGFDTFLRISKGKPLDDEIHKYATDLIFAERVTQFLKSELGAGRVEPSDYFVKWVLKGNGIDGKPIHPGAIWKEIIEKYRPIVKTALGRVRQENDQYQSPDGVLESIEDNSGAKLTDFERELFQKVKAICETSPLMNQAVYDPGSKQSVKITLECKATATYLGLYFNKYWWWFMRANVRTTTIKWVGFNIPPDKIKHLIPDYLSVINPVALLPTRVHILDVNDIDNLKPVILAAFEHEVRKYMVNP